MPFLSLYLSSTQRAPTHPLRPQSISLPLGNHLQLCATPSLAPPWQGGFSILPFLHLESYLYGPASPTSSVFLPWPTQSDVSFHCDLVHTRTCLNNSRSFTNSTSPDHALCCVLLLHSVEVLGATSPAARPPPVRSPEDEDKALSSQPAQWQGRGSPAKVCRLFAGSAWCWGPVGVSFVPSILPGIPPSPPVPGLPVGVQAVGSGLAPPAGTVRVVSQSRPL